jgi:hypothetical protein
VGGQAGQEAEEPIQKDHGQLEELIRAKKRARRLRETEIDVPGR